MFCKIRDFICTSLCSAETESLVQYDFCRTKTSANKIKYFTKHCRMTFFIIYSEAIKSIQVLPGAFLSCLAHRGSTVGFLLLQCSSGVVRHPRDLQVSVAVRFCRVLIFASSQYLSMIYLFHVMIH